MERHCNTLLQSIKSKRYPYASITSFVIATAQLDQIRLLYNLHETLYLDPDKQESRKLVHKLCMFWSSLFSCSLSFGIQTDPDYMLAPPQRSEILHPSIRSKVLACLATRFNVQKSIVESVIKLDRPITQYGRVSRLGGGDLMIGRYYVKEAEDSRDASFVRVSLPLLL